MIVKIRAVTIKIFPSCSSLLCSGVVIVSADWSRCAISPIAVFIPVAMTIPTPLPLVTIVPMNALFSSSPIPWPQ